MKILLNFMETICIPIILLLSISVNIYQSDGIFNKEKVLLFWMYIFIIFLILRALATKLSLKIQLTLVVLYIFLLYYVRFSTMFINHVMYHLTFFGIFSLIIITLINLYRQHE